MYVGSVSTNRVTIVSLEDRNTRVAFLENVRYGMLTERFLFRDHEGILQELLSSFAFSIDTTESDWDELPT